MLAAECRRSAGALHAPTRSIYRRRSSAAWPTRFSPANGGRRISTAWSGRSRRSSRRCATRLADGRIAQAYLFSGIRGVGKTTAARVSRQGAQLRDRTAVRHPIHATNVDRPAPRSPPAADHRRPRGRRRHLLEGRAGARAHREPAYGPARGRYKVVVLDEIHRLSRQAFDALLKIVEEPPPHLVFIFATTESEAVPATILSRCQDLPVPPRPAGRDGRRTLATPGQRGREARRSASTPLHG